MDFEDFAAPAAGRPSPICRRRDRLPLRAVYQNEVQQIACGLNEGRNLSEDCGAGFAFPSQTLYAERSRGPDTQLARAAEEEVERLRAENRLPFPDYEEQVRREMSDTLDYPPKGSPAEERIFIRTSISLF